MNRKTQIIIRALVENARALGADKAQILQRAEKCGILPVLMHALDKRVLLPQTIEMTEDELKRELQRFKMQQTARIMMWQKTAVKVLGVLDMPCIVLKGVPLGERLAGNALWRSTSDVDLWIAQKNVSNAKNLLMQIGYRIGEEPREWATNQVLLVHDVLAPVELHWALVPPPWSATDFDDAYARSEGYSFHGLKMRILSNSDLAIHLLLHAHQHFFAVKTLLDYCEGEDVCLANRKSFERYHLIKLSNIIQMMSNAFTNAEVHTIQEKLIQRGTEKWFSPVLTKTQRGELVFGTDSIVSASLGVIVRASSMGMLDGIMNGFQAGMRVILLGPHRLGALNHKFLYQFTLK